jgi:long-chain acyl-CoA synthetase
MNVTQGLRRMLQVNANELATIDGNRRHSWRELGDRVARLAGALHHSGIKAGRWLVTGKRGLKAILAA